MTNGRSSGDRDDGGRRAAARERVSTEATRRLDEFVRALGKGGLWASVEARVERNVRRPAGRLAGRRGGSFEVAVAAAAQDGATAPGRCFDLASLTKPFVATLALALERSGDLPLAARVGDLFPRAAPALARRRLESLLRHRSGLVPWMPLYRLARGREGALARLLSGELLGGRRGAYSDLGVILWGFAAERATGRDLGALLGERVLAPLALERVEWRPRRRGDLARCPLDNRREVELAAAQGIPVARAGPPALGVVQDGNARFLGRGGRLAGHAGLFADAAAVAGLAGEWLEPGRVLTPALVAHALGGDGEYALGWARRRVRGSAGPALTSAAFGHIGFTGGSVWIDPRRGLVAVLLGHRASVATDLNPWRRRFHALAAELAGER